MVEAKIKSYKRFIDKGMELISETQTILHGKDFPPGPNPDIFAGPRLMMDYHKWVKSIQQFLELNFKDEIEISFFKEADGIPTIEHLDEYDQIGEDFMTPVFAEKIIEEIKKKNEYIREIKRRDSNLVEQSQEAPELSKSKTPKTVINNKDGLGYLIFHGQKIMIGTIESGKFKLLEALCNESFGRQKTVDTVFEITKAKKDKNKIDKSFDSYYLAPIRKLKLMRDQVREINRAIKNHAKSRKLNNFKFCFSLKDENKNRVWLEEVVGRRG